MTCSVWSSYTSGIATLASSSIHRSPMASLRITYSRAMIMTRLWWRLLHDSIISLYHARCGYVKMFVCVVGYRWLSLFADEIIATCVYCYLPKRFWNHFVVFVFVRRYVCIRYLSRQANELGQKNLYRWFYLWMSFVRFVGYIKRFLVWNCITVLFWMRNGKDLCLE